MNTKMKCKFCGSPIEFDMHGNRSYCDEDCYYYAKLERNFNKYEEQKELLQEFINTDKILKVFYEIYGSEKYIPSNLLEDGNMNWDIQTGKKEIDKIKVTVINQFGYALFHNETLVRIWKLKNSL